MFSRVEAWRQVLLLPPTGCPDHPAVHLLPSISRYEDQDLHQGSLTFILTRLI